MLNPGAIFNWKPIGLGKGGAAQAFAWLQSLGTVAGLIAWATLCFCYIRFHAGLKAQSVNRESLPWKSPFQPFTAWYGFIGASTITLITGFHVFLRGNWSASTFVAAYIGIPIFIVPIIVWKVLYRTKVFNCVMTLIFVEILLITMLSVCPCLRDGPLVWPTSRGGDRGVCDPRLEPLHVETCCRPCRLISRNVFHQAG
jgi:hypothetical protein